MSSQLPWNSRMRINIHIPYFTAQLLASIYFLRVFFIIRSFKALDTSKRDKLGSRRLSRAIASFARSLAGINGGNVPFPVFCSFFLLSFFFFARCGGNYISRNRQIRSQRFFYWSSRCARARIHSRRRRFWRESLPCRIERPAVRHLLSCPKARCARTSHGELSRKPVTKGNGNAANRLSTNTHISRYFHCLRH